MVIIVSAFLMMLFLDRLVAGTKLGRGIRAVAEDAPTAAAHARWIVAGRTAGVLRAKLHFTEGSTSLAGPPTSDSRRIHWCPRSWSEPSLNPMDSPASTTIGTCS